MIAVWMLVGWCGTPPGPFPPFPWFKKIIGVLGGIGGGYLFAQIVDDSLLAAALGAWVGAVILNEVAGLAGVGRAR